MTDQEKIQYLSKDTAFGILTRVALELTMSETPAFRLTTVYVLDLTDIHKMNTRYGYLRVNRKIRTALTKVQKRYPEVIMGRIFSGDEIAIVDPEGYYLLITNIKPFFQKEGLGFKYASSEMYLGKSPKYYCRILDKLINSLNRRKYFQAI